MTNIATKKLLLKFQRNEITEYHVYTRLSRYAKGKNRDIIRRIAEDEKRHYEALRRHTGRELKPSRWQVFKSVALARVFGLIFAIKLMEKGEQFAQASYQAAAAATLDLKTLWEDEHRHEAELIAMIREERLNYMGSIVLGLNDALVELTGALAGLSFALQNTRLVALAGLVTGIAASMSMAASEYLSKKSEEDSHPKRSAVYTGVAYIVTVVLLVAPYLWLADYRIALAGTLAIGVCIIALFTYFNSVTRDKPFRRNFVEMTSLSFGVAIISFIVGIILRRLLGIEI